jgi:V/A-type H+-transporting ATPase subunit K
MNVQYLGMACALGLSALGSGLGAGAACSAAVGGWKKCYANGKPAPFILVAFGGVPLTQTIYGFLLMTFIKNALQSGCDNILAMAVGIFGGLAIGLSAWMQGKCAASACDAFAETGKGTANYFMVIGIIETVALFTLVFSLLMLN